MSLRNRVINAAMDAVILRLRTTHQQMVVQNGGGKFNNSCFRNCVQYVTDNPEANLSIIECIFVDSGVPILHYIIESAGVYRDITLGYESKLYEYYYIRTILPADYDMIHKEFQRSQYYWLTTYISAWKRWLFRINKFI